MKRLAYSLAFILSLLCYAACEEHTPDAGGDDNTEIPGGGDNTETPGGDQTPSPEDEFDFDVTYEATNEDFVNPERGWYAQYTTRFEDGEIPSPVSASTLKVGRIAKPKRALTLSLFYLTDFMEGDISDDALNMMRQHLQAHREAGCKAILRFAYKDDYDEENPENTPPPYDAPVNIVIRHVEQLAAVFAEYEDVIYVVQAGFVGAWGEWAYTTYFNRSPSTEEEYAPRKQLLEALLKAVPKSRQIELRTPEYKMKLMGVALKDTITAQTAFNESDISRVGGHNDCFLSNSSDYGTYNSAKERQLWIGDSKYTIMGGETCNPDPNYCNCEKALTAVKNYHWSYINTGYHSGTFEIWRNNGCYDEISIRLGYRLTLLGAQFGDEFAAGKDFPVKIKLENVGFACLMNQRGAEFVITEKDSANPVYKVDLNVDPRTWAAGKTHVIDQTIALPSSLESGKEYELHLNLPDISANLSANPDFSVRFANKKVWNSATGYNKLAVFTAK